MAALVFQKCWRTVKTWIGNKIFFFVLICTLASLSRTLHAGASVELGTGYNVPLGAWSDAYGAGMAYCGGISFSFGEFFNPGVTGFLIFPSTGSVIENAYRNTHGTESISLFAVTGLVCLANHAHLALSDRDIVTLEGGYGIFSQREYVTVVAESYESIDNFSGHGALIGIGLKHRIAFSVFDHLHTFLKCYYSPNKVVYHVVGPGGLTVEDHTAAGSRAGFIIGISLESIGEE
jgi:hypothetical protein